ncbi:hypothetical protein DFH08DRAFT_801847 [Mycena albidolilacea]|uniref:Uncharacterized protein n=1 Tax=Mycena albidolilacea TaxID=1033008 RepID=A0AAD7AG64_9AGAR|nr:hypothetical protein DFH08DRAFT_801847 [Mycena albidolilacea]
MPKQTPAASSLPRHGRHLGSSPSSCLALICSKPPLNPRQDLSPIPRHEAQDSFFKSLLDLSVHIWRDMPQRRQTALTLADTPPCGVSDPHPSPCSSPRASVASWLDQDRRPDNFQSAVPCAPLALPATARLDLALLPVTRCLALGPAASHKHPSPTRHAVIRRACSMPTTGPAASAWKSIGHDAHAVGEILGRDRHIPYIHGYVHISAMHVIIAIVKRDHVTFLFNRGPAIAS